jgi:hypothetical protein
MNNLSFYFFSSTLSLFYFASSQIFLLVARVCGGEKGSERDKTKVFL